MSLYVFIWADAQRAGDPVSKLVLLRLADGCSEGERREASLADLADYCETEVAQVEAALLNLDELGLVTVHSVDGDRFQVSLAYQEPARPDAQPNWAPSKRLRAELEEAYGGKCAVCSSTEELQIDHKHPRSRGGSDARENLQILCKRCNVSKRNKTHEEFMAWRAARGLS